MKEVGRIARWWICLTPFGRIRVVLWLILLVLVVSFFEQVAWHWLLR